MIVTATQIKITSVMGLIRFIPTVSRVTKQLNDAEGIVFIQLKGFTTITGWQTKEHMKAFSQSGAHLEAMKNTKKIGLAKSITWETDIRPSLKEAKQRLKQVSF